MPASTTSHAPSHRPQNIESFVSRLPLTPNTYEGHPPSWQDLLSTLSDITGVPL